MVVVVLVVAVAVAVTAVVIVVVVVVVKVLNPRAMATWKMNQLFEDLKPKAFVNKVLGSTH